MRKTLALLVLLPLLALLQACQTMPTVSLGGAASAIAPVATATLSTNPCEAATAAGYTQTINARRAALKKLNTGAYTVDQAKRVQAAADEARAALDASCNGAAVNNVMLLIAIDRVKNLRNTLEALP